MLDKANNLIKSYDKYLKISRSSDGSKKVIRQSPFDKSRQHLIITIKNQFVGSGRWVLNRLQQSDSQRHDFVFSGIKHNEQIRKNADKYDRNMHTEVARYISENEKIML